MMGIIERLYEQDSEKARAVWKLGTFQTFSPTMNLLRFENLKRAMEANDLDFFINNVRNNFFPDKSPESVAEATRLAMNRGICSLNALCQAHLPEYFPLLKAPEMQAPFNPLEFMKEARKKCLVARNSIHMKSRQPYSRFPREMLDAYVSTRAWGLGHLVLMTDESPEVYNSVAYRGMIEDWFGRTFNFRNASPSLQNLTCWDTNAGVTVFSQGNKPFRHRAKIHDDNGSIRYTSILMKMFLNQKYPDQLFDNYGVELVVADEEQAKKLLSYFKYTIRGTSTVEKYERVESKQDPKFFADKFILRIPMRLPDAPKKETRQPKVSTIFFPLARYIRIPVEVQIRPLNRIDPSAHDLYKQQQYMRVFPLWYPREVYAPILEPGVAVRKLPSEYPSAQRQS